MNTILFPVEFAAFTCLQILHLYAHDTPNILYLFVLQEANLFIRFAELIVVNTQTGADRLSYQYRVPVWSSRFWHLLENEPTQTPYPRFLKAPHR